VILIRRSCAMRHKEDREHNTPLYYSPHGFLRSEPLDPIRTIILLTELTARDHGVKWTVQRLGRLDIVVNNAGEQHPKERRQDITAAQFERTFRTTISSVGRDRRAEIRGRAKLNGLLEGQEAVLQYVGCGGWI
jgi:NAD(P)-dependent dehydrogenase (short-subunit alcohol dehydrogenase family)